MTPVTSKEIFRLIELSEESMVDSVGYWTLPGMSEASPYDFFVATFKPNHSDCDFEYDTQWDKEGDGMNGRGSDFEAQFEDYEDEWGIFWAAFFNSSEALNVKFWEEFDGWVIHRAKLKAKREAEE